MVGAFLDPIDRWARMGARKRAEWCLVVKAWEHEHARSLGQIGNVNVPGIDHVNVVVCATTFVANVRGQNRAE